MTKGKGTVSPVRSVAKNLLKCFNYPLHSSVSVGIRFFRIKAMRAHNYVQTAPPLVFSNGLPTQKR